MGDRDTLSLAGFSRRLGLYRLGFVEAARRQDGCVRGMQVELLKPMIRREWAKVTGKIVRRVPLWFVRNKV
jgi:hypothetical protein